MTDNWKESITIPDEGDGQGGEWIICGACDRTWRLDGGELHDLECPVMERDQLRTEVRELTAQLDRARAAGRRLGNHWKVQTQGEEGLRTMFTELWFTAVSQALGFEEKQDFTKILQAIHILREAPRTEGDPWVPLARAVQHVVGLGDRALEDVDAPQLMAALMEYLDKLNYRAVRHQGRRREAEKQCERMRRRWLEEEGARKKLEASFGDAIDVTIAVLDLGRLVGVPQTNPQRCLDVLTEIGERWKARP